MSLKNNILLNTSLLISLFSSITFAKEINTEYDRILPFYAQSVLDKGFELPFAFGVSLLYTYTTQDFILDDLSVFTKEGQEIDIDEIVVLDNAKPSSHSIQVKADAYILPFLNLFATVGGITGSTPLDVVIKRKGPNKPDVSIPVDAQITGYNFTAGMMLATMYESYFISVPISYTYSMLERSYDYRKVINIAPRIGNLLSLEKEGKLAVFMGANYIDVDLNAKGEVISDDGSVLVYEAHQKNVDKWNMSMGFNWMINKSFSWNLEAGFLGSRINAITGLNYRF